MNTISIHVRSSGGSAGLIEVGQNETIEEIKEKACGELGFKTEAVEMHCETLIAGGEIILTPSKKAAARAKLEEMGLLHVPDVREWFESNRERTEEMAVVAELAVLSGLCASGSHALPLLHGTILDGNLDAAGHLLDSGADSNALDMDHWTPLHTAVCQGHFSVAQLLITHDTDVNAIDNDGMTALHYSYFHRHHDIVSLLMSTPGIDTEVEDYKGMLPVHYK